MIRCPRCGADTLVSETRASSNTTRRRRVCGNIACNGRVTTVEVAASGGVSRRFDGPMSLVPTAEILAIRAAIDSLLGVVDEEPRAVSWARVAEVGKGLGNVLL